MLEVWHFSAHAERKGRYALPPEFDGVVNQWVLHQAVRAYLNNQRQGTHATKTRGLVSGGNRKPWRQKGTGRARQGSIRAPQWPGGGTVFGPQPRSYRTGINRKVRRLARRSALNARAREGKLYVIERLDFEKPKTRAMVELLDKLGLGEQKVLILTAGVKPEVVLSARNLPGVRVVPYAEAAAYDILWSEAVVVEEGAVGGQAVATGEEEPTPARGTGAGKAAPAKPRRTAAKARGAGTEGRSRRPGSRKPKREG
jgi:large subunit ribosomal protein L4